MFVILLLLCGVIVSQEDTHHEGPLLQPLNYRLPRLQAAAPALLGPGVINITVTTSSDVVLPCRVVNLGAGTITWLRYPQLTILSSGDTLFTSSSRVTLEHGPGSPDYNIRIGGVVASDGGQYRCQVDSGRGGQVTRVHLSVTATQPENASAPVMAVVSGHRGDTLSSTRILSSDHVTCPHGGTITLECVVSHQHVPQPPPYFTWCMLDI